MKANVLSSQGFEKEINQRIVCADTLSLSARGYHRTLKLARTLADLDGRDTVGRAHIAEALSYRGETLQRRAAA